MGCSKAVFPAGVTMKLRELFTLQKQEIILEGIEHPEDTIISQGSAGAKRVVNELVGLSKDSKTVSVKWDGFPAVVFGRDEKGQLVFMDKHMYDKVAKGKMPFMTIQDYDQERGSNRSDLWEKEATIRAALDDIVPNVRNQFWMGDLMWSGAPQLDKGFYVFKPNTVEYRVEANSKLGNNIKNSVGGIAVHTFIPGLGESDKPLEGLKGLGENKGITFLTGEMQDKPKIIVDKTFVANTNKVIDQYSEVVDKFLADLAAQKAKSVITAMSPFITSMLSENDIATDIVPRFLSFLEKKLSPAAAQKMLGTNQDGWLYQDDGGAPGLLGIWSMWASVTDLKLHIKRQIDDQQQNSEVHAIIDNSAGHEGYVFGAGKDKLKLVDRLGFSRANFAKHAVSPEEVESKRKMPMAVFCFGRMNPPTLGHKLVMQKTIAVGKQNAFIFLSNSQNSDTDPLDPVTKAAFIKKIYPQFAKHIVSDYVQNPIFAANWLYDKGFRNITFVGGSDRLGKGQGSIEALLTSWNSGPVRTTDNARGPQGREHVVLNFASSGERDADTSSITGISGSLARKYAADGNEQGFQQATGIGPTITVNGKTLYQATREGMGIADQPAAPIEPPQDQKPALKRPDISNVEKELAEIAIESINEDKRLNKATRNAMPYAKTYKNLDSFYDLYRLGIAIANTDERSSKGPSNDSPSVWTTNDQECEMLSKAEKKLGIKGTTIVPKNGSRELDSINTTSPVATKKKNRYGV